jgi:hypothetical protein
MSTTKDAKTTNVEVGYTGATGKGRVSEINRHIDLSESDDVTRQALPVKYRGPQRAQRGKDSALARGPRTQVGKGTVRTVCGWTGKIARCIRQHSHAGTHEQKRPKQKKVC